MGTSVAKEAKQYQAEKNKNGAFAEDSYEAKILKVNELLTEEKDLKKQLITETAKLHNKTKETIETLTDKQVVELLERKWITPCNSVRLTSLGM